MSQKKEKGVSARWRDGDKEIETQREDVWENCPLDNHSSCPFLSFLMDVFSGYFISHVNKAPKGHPAVIMVTELSRTNAELALARSLQSAASKTRHTIAYSACHL